MKRYKLLKDLPFAKAGEEMEMWSDGTIAFTNRPDLPRFNKKDVRMFTTWFEEIKEPEWVYHINDHGDNVSCIRVGSLPSSERYLKEIGNYFETKEEAEKYLEYLKAKAIIKQDTKGFKPNWSDKEQYKYYGYWDSREHRPIWNMNNVTKVANIYFESRQLLEESFKKHPEEWKVYLTYEQ